MAYKIPKGSKLGGGKRFEALKASLARRKGAKKPMNPGALAAYIGRKKLGASRFNRLAAKGTQKKT